MLELLVANDRRAWLDRANGRGGVQPPGRALPRLEHGARSAPIMHAPAIRIVYDDIALTRSE
jgi:hypothetical protein